MTDDYDYQLKAEGVPGSDWVSVTKEEWIKAERAAGFRPPLWSGHPDYMTTCATGGFSNSQGISGRLVRAVPATDQLAAEVLTVDMDAPLTAVDRLRALAGGSRDIAFEPSDADEILEKLEALAAILSAPNLEIGDTPAPAEPSVGATLETDPLKLQGYCQQLLDIIQNYEVDLEGEDNDLIAHISKAVDPAHPVTSEEQP